MFGTENFFKLRIRLCGVPCCVGLIMSSKKIICEHRLYVQTLYIKYSHRNKPFVSHQS
jgi:hypothetical protein